MVAISCFVQDAIAQSNDFKEDKRIYLWDVTLSLKGYEGRTPDIYDDVVKALTSDINSIDDEDTEIVVLPFQTSVLDRWTAKSTKAGKEELISKIKKFNNDKVTNTNIVAPLKEVMERDIDRSKSNLVILMTDGIHNDKNSSKEALYKLIKEWGAFAQDTDSYAFYIMLTKFAEDQELISKINAADNIDTYIADEDISIGFIRLQPQKSISYNIKDKQSALRLPVNIKSDGKKISDDLEIEIKSEDNPYIKIDDDSSIEDGQLKFEIELKMSIDQLKEQLPTDRNYQVTLHLEIDDAQDHKLVKLLGKTVTLELINKPEKTLDIYVKD